MKKTELILSILIITSVFQNLNAQNAEIDSLINLLEQHKGEDTTRVNLLNDIAYSFTYVDFEKNLSYAKEGLELAEKLSFEEGQATSLCHIGWYYYSKADYPTAHK